MNVNSKLPQDSNNNPFNRSMGIPVVCNNKTLGSGTEFRDMIDLAPGRVYIGIMIENPSSMERVQIAIGDDWADQTCIDLIPSGLLTLDGQTFGSFADEESGVQQATKIRAKLDVLTGFLATATFTASGQPSDGQTIIVNGITYEWSDDSSAEPGHVRVPIDATTAGSYANLQDVINNNDPNVVASLGGLVLTLTSNFGGSDGNQMTLSASTTSNVIASGANFSGGSGGVTPIIHIW